MDFFASVQELMEEYAEANDFDREGLAKEMRILWRGWADLAVQSLGVKHEDIPETLEASFDGKVYKLHFLQDEAVLFTVDGEPS